MARLREGQIFPDFTLQTPFEKGLKMADIAAKAPKTAMVFLRYYGCTFCQFDMRNYKNLHKRITKDGGQFLVILQSDPVKLAGQITPESFPYPIVCDPEQAMYKELSIDPAESMEQMGGEKTMAKIALVRATDLKHGDYEGNEMQLPAVFVMNEKRELLYVHYGESGGDSPTAEELEKLLEG